MWYFENDAGKWSRAGGDTDGLSMLSTSKERTQWGFEDPENIMKFDSSEKLNEELARLLEEAEAMERGTCCISFARHTLQNIFAFMLWYKWAIHRQ